MHKAQLHFVAFHVTRWCTSFAESDGKRREVWASGIVTALAAVGLAIINAALPPGPRDYWGTSGHPFDAPEPNYLVVPSAPRGLQTFGAGVD